jgi:FkbM family methyltransferase
VGAEAEMSWRSVVSGAVIRIPGVPGLVVRVWGESYLRYPRHEHPLFTGLKSRLGYRMRKRVALVTGQPIEVDPFDVVGGEIARHGAYEPETVAVWRAILAPGMVVVDAGAHVGQYAIIASPLVGSTGSVHAFEPDPETFRQLTANVRLNRGDNVVCTQAALARERGRAPLFLADVSNVGGNSLRRTVCSRGRQRDVGVETLDEYAAARSLEKLDVLKADVEGAELLVLEGGARLLARHRPLLLLEFSINTVAFGYTEADLRHRLAEWGYRPFAVGPMPLAELAAAPRGLDFYNVLAVPWPSGSSLAARGVIRA